MILQVGVKAFLKNPEGKYLLLRRNNATYQTKGSWDIVGGRIEPGTELMPNLEREVREETGLRIVSEPKLIAAQDIMPNAEKHVVRLTYTAAAEGDITLDTNENVEYAWLSVEEMSAREDLDIYVKALLDKKLLG